MVLDPTLNGENMRFWLTFFIGFVFAHFLSFGMKKYHLIAKNTIFPNVKNSDIIARWSSITFFFIHPV
jgi:hypothetical protein